jgi:hypothetical protein
MRSAGRVVSLAGLGWWMATGLAGRSAAEAGAPATAERKLSVRSSAGRGPGFARAAPAPGIILTGATRESRAVEARLAAFVRAVQRHNGARAVRFLSRETAPVMRAAVAGQDWPWRIAPRDLAPLFALPRLRLQTMVLRRERARVRIAPQRLDTDSLQATGFYDLGMVREGSRWQVTLPSGRG